MKCNKCGIADAETTHLCPPTAGSFATAWGSGSGFTFPASGHCYRCGKPAIGHWSPIPNIAAAAPLTAGPYPLCSEHMADSFGYATKAELESARQRIAELEAQVKTLRGE